MLLAIICLSLLVAMLFATGLGALMICDTAFVADKDVQEPETGTLPDLMPSASSMQNAA